MNNIFKYIYYVVDTAVFNLHYNAWYGAKLNPFENCSYKSFKNNIKKENI